MAAAAGPIAGIGTSIIGGIQGKGAQKRQEQLLKQQMAQLQPLINAQTQGLQFSLDQGRQLFPAAQNAIQTVFNSATGSFEPLMKDYQSMLNNALTTQGKFNAEGDELMSRGRNLLDSANPQLMGIMSGLGDLQASLRPFINEGASAIEKFLPGGSTLNRLLAGQMGDINQGFKSASQNIEAFAPRGGGRISSLANADINRQQQLNQARSQGTQNFGQMALNNFFQGVEGSRNLLGQQGQLELGRAQQQGQLGLGAIGAGQQSKQLGISDFGSKAGVGLQQLQAALQSLGIGAGAAGNLGQLASGALSLGNQGGGNIYDMVNQQANRTFSPSQSSGKGLGGYVVDLFNTPGIFGGGKKGGGGFGNMGGGKVPTSMPGGKV